MSIGDSGPSKRTDPERWRCTWTDGRERCHFPGSMSHDTRGGGPWYCRFHFFCSDAIVGQKIIEQSRGWQQGEPVGFVAPRAHAARPAPHIPAKPEPSLDQSEPGSNG